MRRREEKQEKSLCREMPYLWEKGRIFQKSLKKLKIIVDIKIHLW